MNKDKKNKSIVYIADPDERFLSRFKAYLGDSPISLYAFTDGRTLVETTSAKRPALIILNTELPVVNGLQVIDEIVNSNGGPVPFVVIIGSNSERMQAEVVKRQVLCSLLSPPDFDDLKSIILKVGVKHE